MTPGYPWTPRKCSISKEYLCVFSSNIKLASWWVWLRNLSWSAKPLPCLIWINNSLKDNRFGSRACPEAKLGSISVHALPGPALPCPAPADVEVEPAITMLSQPGWPDRKSPRHRTLDLLVGVPRVHSQTCGHPAPRRSFGFCNQGSHKKPNQTGS